MNDPIFWRLVWKEYRAQRQFWLVMAGCVVGFQIAIHFMFGREGDQGLASVAVLFPLFYAAGCGACLFALEKEDGTFDLLRSLPVSAGRLLASKFLLGLASLIVLIALGWLTFFILAESWLLKDRGESNFALIVRMSFECLAWGALFSLLTRRVMIAVCLAAVPMVFVYLVATSYHATQATFRDFFWSPFYSYNFCILLVLNYFCTRAWIVRPAAEWRFSLPGVGLVGVLARIRSICSAEFPSERHFFRLVWLECRNARGVAYVLGAAAFCWAFESGILEWRYGWHELFSILAHTIVPLMMGLWTFQSEQRGRHYRFMTDRGVSPSLFWASKHTVWLSLALALTAAWFLTYFATSAAMHPRLLIDGIKWLFGNEPAWMISNPAAESAESFSARAFATYRPRIDQFRVTFLTACNCYAAGQFASLLIPRSIVAAGVGLLLMTVVLIWESVMFALGVPVEFSVLPIPLVLMVATYLRVPDWLRERNRWQAWAPLVAMIAVPACMVMTSVAIYRVYEIPRPPDQTTAQPTPDLHRAIAGNFVRAATLVTNPGFDLEPNALQDTILKGWEFATAGEKEWLEKNRAALGALRSGGRQENPTESPEVPAPLTFFRLGRLILFSAREREADKKFDEAFEDYLAALELSTELAARGQRARSFVVRSMAEIAASGRSDTIRAIATSLRSSVYRFLPGWAAAPGQTSAAVRKGIEQIRLQPRFFPPWTTPAFWVGEPHPTNSFAMNVWNYLPWERWRAERLVRLLDEAALQRKENIEQQLQHPATPLVDRDFGDSFESGAALLHAPYQWLSTTTFIAGFGSLDAPYDRIITDECQRRALLIILALVAWEWEHGKLPAQLADLKEESFEVPDNPWTGGGFGYQPKGTPVGIFRKNLQALSPHEPFLWCVLPLRYLNGPQQLPSEKFDFAEAVRLIGHHLPIFPIPRVENASYIAEPDKVLDEVRSALDRRWEQLNPIRVKYRIHSFHRGNDLAFLHPAQAVPMKAAGAPPAPPRPISQLAGVDVFLDSRAVEPDRQSVAEYEWARKGEKTRHSITAQALVDGTFVPQGEPALNVYDGTRAILFLNRKTSDGGAPEFEVTANPASVVGFAEFPFHLTLENQLRIRLQNASQSSLQESIDMEWQPVEEEGRLLLLDFRVNGDSRQKLWLSPKLGYAVTKHESYTESRQLKCRGEAKYPSADGLAVPNSVVVTDYLPPWRENGAMAQEARVELLSVVTDANEIPDELFEVKLPENAVIRDQNPQPGNKVPTGMPPTGAPPASNQ